MGQFPYNVSEQWLRDHSDNSHISNEEILAQIEALHVTPQTAEDLTRLLALLVVQPPIVQYLVNIGESAWSRYMRKSKRPYSSMHTALKFIQANQIFQAIFLAYERYPEFRPHIEFLHELEGDNRIPYFHVLVKTLRQKFPQLQHQYDFRTPEGLRDFLMHPEVDGLIKDSVANNRGKFIGGATNTVIGLYDFIMSSPETIKPRIDLIESANHRIDYGGGFATPDISRVLGHQFQSYDINDPTQCDDALIFTGQNTPKDFDLTAYMADLRSRPWTPFDVFENEFETGKGPYAITSFGFLTSTVTSQSKSDRNEKNMFSTLLNGLRRVANLVASGEDVYCYWYSRASVRLYQNAIIQLHFQDGKLVWNTVHACYFSKFKPFQATLATALDDDHLYRK